MKLRNIMIAVVVTSMFAACAPHSEGGIRKQDAGTIIGALGGALAAKSLGKGTGNVLSIAAGTLLGAYVGTQIGASLDRADMAFYNKASHVALERNKIGAGATWTNPDSGHTGTITPTKTVLQTDGKTYCREFTQTVTIAGETQQAYGEACRAPDGTWKIKQQ